MKKNVGILIFDDAEVLDFCGPFEVFAITSELNGFELFDVFTVAKTSKAIRAVNGLSVNPSYAFRDAPPIDILVISGGVGTRKVMQDEETLNWVRTIHEQTQYTVCICSGSRIVGVLGLLDNKPFCTHHEVYDHMAEIAPTGIPQKNKRYVNYDKLYTSGGISAGIDLSFHIVERLHGKAVAERTANYMEYYTRITENSIL